MKDLVIHKLLRILDFLRKDTLISSISHGIDNCIMNKTIKILLLLALVFFVIGSQAQKTPVEYVNPFIGTSNYGATNPGAVCPMGMVSVVPFNTSKAEGNLINTDDGWCSTPYVYENKTLTGFAHVNFSSVGCPDLGSIILMPLTGEPEVDFRKYGTFYSMEEASPGYYSAFLDRYNVRAEMTATLRSGLSRYTFPEGNSQILLDLGHGLTNESGAYLRKVSENEVEGMKLMGTFCYNPQDVFPVYFAVRLSKSPDQMRYWKKQKELPGPRGQWSSTSGKFKLYEAYGRDIAGDDIGVVFSYSTTEDEEIEVQVGISYVSIGNAWLNLDAEQEGFDFDQTLSDARSQWERLLERIVLEGGSEEDREMFYTAFYHTLLHPNVFQDVNGEYPAMGSGKTMKWDQGNRYTMFSLWDTYRTFHPLKCLLFPDQQLEMVKSMLSMYEESGALPKWEFAGQEFNVMEGDPALVVISDTYIRGIRNFDIEMAWKAMSHNAFAPSANNSIRPDNDFYSEHFYVPITRDYDNSVSQAVEYYIADWSLGQFAGSTGHPEEAEILQKRSMGFKKYFDPAYGLLRPVKENGEFFEPFDPLMGENFEPSHGFHEGTSWNYSFSLPHALNELINLLGGPRGFESMVERAFTDSLFDMTNEPDIGYPWYFNYVKGSEWKTSKYVKDCIRTYFSTEPGGLPGNDDAGTLSAWLMYSMMGFYPVCPADPKYALTTPVFRSVRIKLDENYYPRGELLITTDRDPGQYPYLKAVNGKRSKYFIEHDELVRSGRLELKLTDQK
jgi:predicted alpha-1,2-mannosidase